VISVICPSNRVGGVDVLFSCLREQTDQNFEVIVADDLFFTYRLGLPQVGKGGVWHMSPGVGPRWGRYMSALNRAVSFARGDVLLFLSDYTAAHPETIATHAAFHASHGPKDVALGGIEYCSLPELHPDFPRLYGWSKIGHDPANYSDETYAPWLDDKRRHELYAEFREAYERDLANGTLAPFMHSTFAEPFNGWKDTEALKVYETNLRGPPSQFLNLKNDSFKRSLLEEIGGFDERADGTHGHQDSITHRHMAKAGAVFHPVPQNPCRVLDAHPIAVIRRFSDGKDDGANLKIAESLQ